MEYKRVDKAPRRNVKNLFLLLILNFLLILLKLY